MKKVLFAILACVTLLAVSCETTDTSSDDQLYQHGIEKSKLTKKI